ncbi:TraB/GumN family protein [Paenibacillus odorifer]|uniref:TraB/GumN family protein n=1 Tax=Paenibacillus odorifer TaxID=189426 RepID=A0A1R0Y305_9BACL|nr:TraB/GumN family protein [Paenibacillus odorifer]OMD41712.1 hypothetical protein BSK52_09720 [Paenibacillus odorifer]
MKKWRRSVLWLILSVCILVSGACSMKSPQQAASKANNQEIEYASNSPTMKGVTIDGARGFMWEVKNNGTTVYLVGSIHLTDDNFYPLHSKYEKVFAEADYLGLEIDFTKAPDEEQQKRIVDMMMYKDGTTLKDHVSKETYAKVKEFLMKNGLEANAYDAFKPWQVEGNISVMSLKADYNLEEGIDLYFLQKALERKIPVIGLETQESQMGALAGFSKERQEKSLNTTLDDYNSGVINDPTDELIEMWKKGDEQTLLKITNSLYSDPEYGKAMLTDRNIGMAEKIEGYLNTNKEDEYFIVVGALHYLGEYGIIELLQDKGFTVFRK